MRSVAQLDSADTRIIITLLRFGQQQHTLARERLFALTVSPFPLFPPFDCLIDCDHLGTDCVRCVCCITLWSVINYQPVVFMTDMTILRSALATNSCPAAAAAADN